jgi:hypothetical protein
MQGISTQGRRPETPVLAIARTGLFQPTELNNYKLDGVCNPVPNVSAMPEVNG